MKKLFLLVISMFVICNSFAQRTTAQRTPAQNARSTREASSINVPQSRTGTRQTNTSADAARQRSAQAGARAARTTGTRAGVVTKTPITGTTTATTETKSEAELTAAELTKKFNEQMLKVEAVLEVQSQCQEKFNTCMDNFCKDESVGRCLCSNDFSSIKPIKDEIQKLTSQTNELLQEQLAKAKMSEKERSFYEQQKIALNLKSEEIAEYGSISIDSLKVGLYTGTESSDFSNKTGEQLFQQAKKSCQPILDACPTEGKSITTFYQTSASKECKTAKNTLEEQKTQIQFARNKAEFEVKKAAFNTIAQKLDNSTCLTELKSLIEQDALCGSKYSNCLNCNEEFNTSKNYTLAISNANDKTDTTSNFTKKYTGCTAMNIEKIVAKKEVFNTVLDKCSSPLVAWNTFMIDFATQMEKSAKDQMFVYQETQREKEFDVADTCQKEIDKCLQEICGSGYLSCTSKEKAAQYNIALIDDQGAQQACQTTYTRCSGRIADAGQSVRIDDIWSSAWKKSQNQADQTYQKKLATLITETGNVEKAQAKMEAELAESKARSVNTISRLNDVLGAENALQDAQLNMQKAKAETEEAKVKIEKTKATQTAGDALDLAQAQRGCEKAAGQWDNGNCYWKVVGKGYTCKKGQKKSSYGGFDRCGKDKNKTSTEVSIKIAAGSSFACSEKTMGGATDYGCTWTGGAIKSGESYTFPDLKALIKRSDSSAGSLTGASQDWKE